MLSLGILALSTTVNAAKSYPVVQSSLTSLVDQSITVNWFLDGDESEGLHVFKTTLNCGIKNLSGNVEVAMSNPNTAIKDSKWASLVIAQKVIMFDKVTQTLGFGTGERYFCDGKTLKIDFKNKNYISEADKKAFGDMWDAAHPVYELGRFNLTSSPISISKPGDLKCGFIFILFADVKNNKLQGVKSQVNALNNCLTGFYYKPQVNQFYQYKTEASDMVVLGERAPLKMEKITSDDVLLFYWTTDVNKNDGWFRTVVDTRKDQYWTVPVTRPSGVSVGK